jgi:hypothetical protein
MRSLLTFVLLAAMSLAGLPSALGQAAPSIDVNFSPRGG